MRRHFRQSDKAGRRRSPSRRDGAILVVALIVLAVVSAVSAGLLHRGSLHRKELQHRQWMIQAEWLAESGLSRGVVKLRADPKFEQETWLVPAETLGGQDPARVVLSAQRNEKSPGRLTLTVMADYPDRPHDRARSRRSIDVALPPAE